MVARVNGEEWSRGNSGTMHHKFEDMIAHISADETLLTGRLSSSTHWLLDEHRTGHGHALVPGTGFLELAAESLAAVGESSPFEVRDLYFFRPLHVPDGRSRAIRVHLRRSIEGYELGVESEIVLDEPGGSGKHGWQTHAQARIVLGHLEPPAHVDLAACAEESQFH